MNPEARKYFSKAFDLQKYGQLDEAVNYYCRSLGIEPTAEAYTFLGWTIQHNGANGRCDR